MDERERNEVVLRRKGVGEVARGCEYSVVGDVIIREAQARIRGCAGRDEKEKLTPGTFEKTSARQIVVHNIVSHAPPNFVRLCRVS